MKGSVVKVFHPENSKGKSLLRTLRVSQFIGGVPVCRPLFTSLLCGPRQITASKESIDGVR